MGKVVNFNNFLMYMGKKIKNVHVSRVKVKLKKSQYPADHLSIAINVKIDWY